MFAQKLQPRGREIIFRTRGRTHGPITRLVSPSDLGELIKPFVFLDLAAFDGRLAPMPMDYGWHPHSGIATVTVMLDGAVRFAETTGKDGVLPAGSVEWMRASNGVWHTGAGVVRGVKERARGRVFSAGGDNMPALEKRPWGHAGVPLPGARHRHAAGRRGRARPSRTSLDIKYLDIKILS